MLVRGTVVTLSTISWLVSGGGRAAHGVIQLIEGDAPGSCNLLDALLRAFLAGMHGHVGWRSIRVPGLGDEHTLLLSGDRLVLLSQERALVNYSVFADALDYLHGSKPSQVMGWAPSVFSESIRKACPLRLPRDRRPAAVPAGRVR